MELPESQNARDARVEQLWRKLDSQKKGEIDLHELQRGLRKIDHPLKNASDMLKDVVKAMDKNGDEVIQYEGMVPYRELARGSILLMPELSNILFP